MRENELRITPSIIDRLIDLEPEFSSEASVSLSQELKDFRTSVLRDIEWLLNSRFPYTKIPKGLEEVNRSVAVYGIPDFTGMSSKDARHNRELIGFIEEALAKFEPRIMNVKVVIEETDIVNRGVQFQIEGLLRIDPTPEPIIFDTVYTVGNSGFKVKERPKR